MRIHVTSIFVDDQAEALEFYTKTLGFEKKTDLPAGDYRWLTVVAPDQRDGVELLLEPSAHAAVPPFKDALKRDGIPFASFQTDDVEREYRRLRGLKVNFTREPTASDGAVTAVFDDTCGNLVQLFQARP